MKNKLLKALQEPLPQDQNSVISSKTRPISNYVGKSYKDKILKVDEDGFFDLVNESGGGSDFNAANVSCYYLDEQDKEKLITLKDLATLTNPDFTKWALVTNSKLFEEVDKLQNSILNISSETENLQEQIYTIKGDLDNLPIGYDGDNGVAISNKNGEGVLIQYESDGEDNYVKFSILEKQSELPEQFQFMSGIMVGEYYPISDIKELNNGAIRVNYELDDNNINHAMLNVNVDNSTIIINEKNELQLSGHAISSDLVLYGNGKDYFTLSQGTITSADIRATITNLDLHPDIVGGGFYNIEIEALLRMVQPAPFNINCQFDKFINTPAFLTQINKHFGTNWTKITFPRWNSMVQTGINRYKVNITPIYPMEGTEGINVSSYVVNTASFDYEQYNLVSSNTKSVINGVSVNRGGVLICE